MKNLYFTLFILVQAFYLTAQSPTFIEDGSGDGTVYYLRLADGTAECPNYGADITINSVTYELSYCDAAFDEVEFTIAAGATPVIITTDAPITIVNGGTSSMYDASGNLVVLPVELTTFTAEAQKNQTNLLEWETASEENNEGFEVERSVNGSDWETLDFVEGNGSTIEISNYDFVDKRPFDGTNYYRLKQLDFDGKFEYSKIVTVELAKDNEQLTIIPNPVQDELTITNVENVESVIIYNMLGQEVKQLIVGNAQLSINTSDLPKGQYILSVQKKNGKTITEQFYK